MVVNYRN